MNNANNVKATVEFLNKKGIKSGMKQEDQILLITYLLNENGLLAEDANLGEVLGILNSTVNCSALRQKLEAAGHLTKTEGGRAKMDAEALATKYANLF